MLKPRCVDLSERSNSLNGEVTMVRTRSTEQKFDMIFSRGLVFVRYMIIHHISQIEREHASTLVYGDCHSLLRRQWDLRTSVQ